jgi:hypothetical protein
MMRDVCRREIVIRDSDDDDLMTRRAFFVVPTFSLDTSACEADKLLMHNVDRY